MERQSSLFQHPTRRASTTARSTGPRARSWMAYTSGSERRIPGRKPARCRLLDGSAARRTPTTPRQPCDRKKLQLPGNRRSIQARGPREAKRVINPHPASVSNSVILESCTPDGEAIPLRELQRGAAESRCTLRQVWLGDLLRPRGAAPRCRTGNQHRRSECPDCYRRHGNCCGVRPAELVAVRSPLSDQIAGRSERKRRSK